MRAIVIGSNGYIGMHMVHKLKTLNWDVNAFDVQSKSVIDVPYKSLDISDRAAVDLLDFNVDVVFLFSGVTGTAIAYDRYEIFIDVNEKGILNLLNAIKRQQVKPRVVFPSTRLVYKGVMATPLKEESEKECKSVYALNKMFCESVLGQYASYFGIDHTIFRICVPYGNMLTDNYSYGTLGFFVSKAVAGQNITLYGNGSQARTFSYLGDICTAILSAALKDESKNQVYNIGGEAFALNNVAHMVAAKFGVGVDYIAWPELEYKMESGDTIFDSQKLNRLIGNYQSIQLADWIDHLSI